MKLALAILGLLLAPISIWSAHWYVHAQTTSTSAQSAMSGLAYAFFCDGYASATPCPDDKTPQPVWVPDPSAGHYDCPIGWSEYARREPNPDSGSSQLTINDPFPKDAKGHVLGSLPAPGICVKEKP